MRNRTFKIKEANLEFCWIFLNFRFFEATKIHDQSLRPRTWAWPGSLLLAGQVVASISRHTWWGRTGRTGNIGGLEEQKWNSRAEEEDADLALHHFQGEAEMCTPVRVAALKSTLKIGKLWGVCLQKNSRYGGLRKRWPPKILFWREDKNWNKVSFRSPGWPNSSCISGWLWTHYNHPAPMSQI